MKLKKTIFKIFSGVVIAIAIVREYILYRSGAMTRLEICLTISTIALICAWYIYEYIRHKGGLSGQEEFIREITVEEHERHGLDRTFGILIKPLRQKLNQTRENIEKLMRIREGTLEILENNPNLIPKPWLLEKIALGLGCPKDYFFSNAKSNKEEFFRMRIDRHKEVGNNILLDSEILKRFTTEEKLNFLETFEREVYLRYLERIKDGR